MPPAPPLYRRMTLQKQCTRYRFIVQFLWFVIYFCFPATLAILASLCVKILAQGGGGGRGGARCCIDSPLSFFVVLFLCSHIFSLALVQPSIYDAASFTSSQYTLLYYCALWFDSVTRWVQAFRAGLSFAVSILLDLVFAFILYRLSLFCEQFLLLPRNHPPPPSSPPPPFLPQQDLASHTLEK